MTRLALLRGARILACCLLLAGTQAFSQQSMAPGHSHRPDKSQGHRHSCVPGQLIIQFKAAASDAEIADAIQCGGMDECRHIQTESMRHAGHPGVTHARTKLPVEEAIQSLQNHPAIEYVEPNWIYEHQAVSNDPYFTGGYLWGAAGDLIAPANAYGSQAAEAWNAGYTGSRSVYVGIIDEGIQFTHPDLAANMWNNPYDAPNGIDDDGNGYKDDLRGWNFAAENNSIFTSGGDDHGTHVAGTIGAVGGNAAGMAGINWSVTMISGKFLGATGGTTLDAIQAIDYFVNLKKRYGLNIVALNCSWGGGGYSQSLHDAILRAAKANILIIAAAGNGDANGNGINIDVYPSYPACYDTTRGTSTQAAASYNAVIAVAAIDQYGNRARFSNYGAKTVHIGAPGVSIHSTVPNNSYAAYNGTSMATPHVTGAAALYASTHPGATPLQIRNALLSSAISTPSLTGYTTTGGRLNLSSIIAPAPTVPAAPTGLTATAGTTSISLRWTATPGASSYVVRRSTTSGGPYTTVASGLSAPSYTDATALTPGTRYYYVVAAVNTAGTSANSAQVSAALPVPTTPSIPAAPTGLTAAAASSSQLSLRWTDASSNETGFRIEIAPAGGSFFEIGTLGANTTACSISGAQPGTTYYFRIRAYNGSGNSAYSNTASVRTY